MDNPGSANPVQLATATIYFIGPAVIATAALTFWARLGGSTDLRHYLIIAAVMPIVVFALLSFRDYSGSRYAFPCLFPWLALVALGVSALYGHLHTHVGKLAAWTPLWLILVSMMLVNLSYYVYNPGFRPRWNDAMAYVVQHRAPGEQVYVDPVWVGQYYLKDASVAPLSMADHVAQADQPAWFVLGVSDPNRFDHPRVPPTATLAATYLTNAIKPVHCVRVYRYEQPSTADRNNGE